MVDTGSPVTLINEQTANQLNLDHRGSVSLNLTSVNGEQLMITAELMIDVKVDGMKCETMVYVAKNVKEAVILGRDTLSKLRMKIDCEAPACVVGLISEYPGSLPSVVGVSHQLELRTDQPVACKPYRIPAHYEEKVAEMLTEMEGNGIIRKSRSPYAAPVVVVPKKDGTLRLCADYRQLNAVTKIDPFPMPNLKEVVRAASSGKVFSTMDVKNGFWQVPMRETDIE